MRFLWIGILLLSVSAGEGRASATREVEAAMQEYARLQAAKDAAGLAASYTADGELLEPGMESLKGPAAIRQFLESFGDVRIESSSMTSERVQVWKDDALQWGSYAQRVELPGQPVMELHGRFVAQWTRHDGRWLLRCLLTQPA
jgi:uncharacterized protein (TIGR02246 family)